MLDLPAAMPFEMIRLAANDFEPSGKVRIAPRQEPNSFCPLDAFSLVFLGRGRRRVPIGEANARSGREPGSSGTRGRRPTAQRRGAESPQDESRRTGRS